MTRLSVHLPEHVSKSIRERADETGYTVERVIVDALKNTFVVTTKKSKKLSEQDRAIHALIAAGLVRPVRRASRRVSTKRRAELAQAFSKGKSLSEIVIEERGERV
ncbi:MAG: hypothetical protein HY868_20705 [Chloroflexi bacterium]|nr:hypothetical protein [Chloroflexota bacterium]